METFVVIGIIIVVTAGMISAARPSRPAPPQIIYVQAMETPEENIPFSGVFPLILIVSIIIFTLFIF